MRSLTSDCRAIIDATRPIRPETGATVSPKQDFLDEIIAERSEHNPDFPLLVEQAQARRELLRELATARAELDLSQTKVAAIMGTSQSSLARLESSAMDAKLSTVERMAAALGLKLQFHLVDAKSKAPAVIRN